MILRAPSSYTLVFSALALVVASCTPGGGRSFRDGGDDVPDGSPPPRVDSGPPAFRCTAGQNGCFGNTHYRCGDDGVTRLDELPCPEACAPGLGCVSCRPGSRHCEGDVSMVCTADGVTYAVGRDCGDWGSSCGSDGFCADSCAEAERSRSNVGCEYWPTPLSNIRELDRAAFDFRVVVANPGEVEANVRVTRGGADVFTGAVAPGELREITLPWIDEMSFGIPVGNWQSLVTANGAYRLTSDAPVIATQFNPFEYNASGSFSYTNDATLLYPQHVLTGDYVGASYPPLSRRTGGGLGGTSTLKVPGYIAIVGISPTPTRVQVQVAGHVVASSDGRVPATMRGGTFIITLARGEVAHVAAAAPPDCAPGRPGYVNESSGGPFGGSAFETCHENEHDLTGTRVQADAPVAVFGGHTCAYVPTSAQACDHLEVQMPPMQSWGRRFVSAPMGDGSLNDVNIVRVMPAFEATLITITPPQGGVPGGTVSPGSFLEFEASGPFEVEGSSAIMVAQYLRGQYAPTPEASRGDPAMTVLVPAEQYRPDYTFLLPSSYNAGVNGQNHIMVVRPPGLSILLNGTEISATWSPISDQEIAVIPLPGGTHRIEATLPFGLIAYGLGSFTSYATPGGLNLEEITILR